MLLTARSMAPRPGPLGPRASYFVPSSLPTRAQKTHVRMSPRRPSRRSWNDDARGSHHSAHMLQYVQPGQGGTSQRSARHGHLPRPPKGSGALPNFKMRQLAKSRKTCTRNVIRRISAIPGKPKQQHVRLRMLPRASKNPSLRAGVARRRRITKG